MSTLSLTLIIIFDLLVLIAIGVAVPSAARFQWRYPRLDCPIRVIHGENDKLVEKDRAKRLDIALPRSRLHTVDQAGHMVHYADLDGIMQAIDDLEMETVGFRLTAAL